jgi:hypothetical protein
MESILTITIDDLFVLMLTILMVIMTGIVVYSLIERKRDTDKYLLCLALNTMFLFQFKSNEYYEFIIGYIFPISCVLFVGFFTYRKFLNKENLTTKEV